MITLKKDDDRLAIVEMSDCGLLSVHDSAEARDLRDILLDVAHDDAVRAVVLTAAGRDFCAERPQELKADITAMPWYRDYATSSGLYQTVCYYPKVVIAAVQGACTGAGSALLLCADLAVVSDDAMISAPFATIPEASFTLAALSMRLNNAKAWALSEEPMDAVVAERVGLINRVVPRTDLLTEARAMGAAAARMPLDGMAMTKLLRETYLDSQSVGREFDQARFYAAGLRSVAVAGRGPAS